MSRVVRSLVVAMPIVLMACGSDGGDVLTGASTDGAGSETSTAHADLATTLAPPPETSTAPQSSIPDPGTTETTTSATKQAEEDVFTTLTVLSQDEGVQDALVDLVAELREADLVTSIERSVVAVDESVVNFKGRVAGYPALLSKDGTVSVCMGVMESVPPLCDVSFPVSLSVEAAAAFDALADPEIGGVRYSGFVYASGDVEQGALTLTEVRRMTEADRKVAEEAGGFKVEERTVAANPAGPAKLFQEGSQLLIKNDDVVHPIVLTVEDDKTMWYVVPFFDASLGQMLVDLTGFNVKLSGFFGLV